MITPDGITALRAELTSARNLLAARNTQLQTLEATAAAAKQQRSEIENQLSELRALLGAIGPRTIVLQGTLAKRESEASAAESRLIEKETKLGIAGIEPEKAIKAPKEQGGTAPGVTAADEQYLQMKRREDAGEVPNGTAFKLWRSLKSTEASQESAKRPASGGATWGEHIVSGSRD